MTTAQQLDREATVLVLPVTTYTCQGCQTVHNRGRSGPIPQWCPECRAQRNRDARAEAHKATSTPRGAVPGTRWGGAFPVPPRDHLARRVTELRLLNKQASSELHEVLHFGSTAELYRVVQRVIVLLDNAPTGRA